MKRDTGSAIELFLHPGEWDFVDRQFSLRTTLGSCIAFTLWHPERRLGGMCHYMLPERDRRDQTLNARYAGDAIELLLAAVDEHRTRISDYQIKIIGGGTMFSSRADEQSNIAQRNIAAARRLAAAYDLSIQAEHVGGRGYRNVYFDVLSGDVWVRYVSVEQTEQRT